MSTAFTTFPAYLRLVNTLNLGHAEDNADYVYFPSSIAPVAVGNANGAKITVEPVGFGKVSSNGFVKQNQFHVLELQTATAELYAQIKSPCEPIVRNAVRTFLTENGRRMNATFKPNFNLTIDAAAGSCGYDHFNWYQLVTHLPPGSPIHPKNAPSLDLSTITPFFDPVAGGFNYDSDDSNTDNLPFYWDDIDVIVGLHMNKERTKLIFYDTPGYPGLPHGESIKFTTCLVGVMPNKSMDAVYCWNWQTTFNKTTGSIGRLSNSLPSDTDSGTGGVTILKTDLTAEELPRSVRDRMIHDGVRNVDVQSYLDLLPLPLLYNVLFD